VGDLVAHPEAALAARFGKEAARLRALASNDPQLPIQPRPFDEPIRVSLAIEPPDDDHARLLFGIKGALHELLELVQARALTLRALRIELDLEDGGRHLELVEPAAPTRDAMLILDLVRLRLADVALTSPASGIAVEALTAKPEGDQLAMFRVGPRRDLAAGERALARVRAAFGADAVTRARVRDAHLPEARFAWEPTATLRLAKTTASGGSGAERDAEDEDEEAPLVRRVLVKPHALASRDPEDAGVGPRLEGVVEGGDEVVRLFGPYRLSGGWWVRNVERDYYYAETARGDLLWLYFDRPRQRWFLHGVVD
jgi:protein ImuB